MTRLLATFAVLALLTVPARADEIGDSLNAAWMRQQEATGNLRNALLALVQERAAIQARLADVITKCGDRCAEPAPAPQAETKPVPAPATKPEAPHAR